MEKRFFEKIKSISRDNNHGKERERKLVNVAEELRRYDLPDNEIIAIVRTVFAAGRDYESELR